MIVDIAMAIVLLGVLGLAAAMVAPIVISDTSRSLAERRKRAEQAEAETKGRQDAAQDLLDRTTVIHDAVVDHAEKLLAADEAGDTFLTVADREALETLVADWRRDHPKQ